MRRVSVFLLLAALVPGGCATHSTALPELSFASLPAPGEPAAAFAEPAAASAWSELELPAPARQDEDEVDELELSEPWIHHVTLMVGERSLDEDEWGRFDSPTIVGVELDETSSISGNGIEAGVFYSNEERDDVFAGIPGDVEFTTWEFYVGLRHTFRPGEGGLHPFVSAGIEAEHGRAKLSAPGVSESDNNLVAGAYARAGLLWDVTDRVRLGADYRYVVTEDFELFDTDIDNNRGQVAFTVGFAF